MSKTSKIVLCFLIIFIPAVAIVLVGCAGSGLTPVLSTATTPAQTTVTTAISTPTPTPTLTVTVADAPSLATQDLINNTVNSLAKLTSYQYDVNMTLKMSGNIKNQTQNASIAATGNGVNDITGNKMQMTMNMDIESPDHGKMSIPMIYYLVDGWQYVKVSTPFTGAQWMKMKMDMNSFDAKDQTGQALEMLKSAITVTAAGTEDVDGVACYVLQVSPDLTVLSAWLEDFQQSTNLQGIQQANIDLSKFMKNLSIKEWVVKDSYILKKSDISATITLNGTDFGSSAQASDNLTMDIAQTTKISQYNQPVVITLPPEALNAQDMRGQKKSN